MIKNSIVIGALNEEKRLPKTIICLLDFLKEKGLSENTEIIIVAAKGKDKTAKVAKNALKNFPKYKVIQPDRPVGKGRDIMLGMLSAKGRYIIYMDADLATPLKHVLDVLSILENDDSDIVIGVRDLKKMHSSISRQLISVFGNICYAMIGGKYIPDTQCGFKGFNDKSAKLCFSKLTRMHWSFDMEVLIIATQNDLSIAQLPINDWQDVADGTFKGNLKHTIVFGKDLAVMFINKIRGRYKIEKI